jgi:hypothetical protein
MPYCEMRRCEALVRIDVSEEPTAYNAGMKRISELRIMLALTIADLSSVIIFILMMEEIRSSETSFLTLATRRRRTEDGILHSHRRENLKSYITLTGWTV